MSENQAMSDERLVPPMTGAYLGYLEQMTHIIRSETDAILTPRNQAVVNCYHEIVRLRAENERLANHLHDEHCCQHDLS